MVSRIVVLDIGEWQSRTCIRRNPCGLFQGTVHYMLGLRKISKNIRASLLVRTWGFLSMLQFQTPYCDILSIRFMDVSVLSFLMFLTKQWSVAGKYKPST